MAENSARPVLVILLVGTNPLPNFLTVCALRPRRMALVYTEETEKTANRLEQCVRTRESGVEVRKVWIPDAASAREVADRVRELVLEHSRSWRVVLSYTGGTKVMAAHALNAFYNAGGKREDSCYLEDGGPDGSPRLRFDDGTCRKLTDCDAPPLSFETLLALHGARLQRRSPRQPAPTLRDVEALARLVLNDPSVARRLYEGMRETFGSESDPRKLLARPFDPRDYELELSIGRFPTAAHIESFSTKGERESWFEQWRHFIGGGWLEDWVAARIEEACPLGDAGQEVVLGFQVFRGERQSQLEVDLAVVRKHRSYFVSCTTAQDKACCKQKLFEIAVRARQLAGDLARPALVCLARGPTLSRLRDEVDGETAPGGAFRVAGVASVHVFGLEDLRAWNSWQGAPSNLESLRWWLDS